MPSLRAGRRGGRRCAAGRDRRQARSRSCGSPDSGRTRPPTRPGCSSVRATPRTSTSMNVAAPSLSQMSRQPRSATESPNHWWASSCTTSQMCSAGQRRVGRARLVLEREAGSSAGDQATGRAERVVAEVLLEAVTRASAASAPSWRCAPRRQLPGHRTATGRPSSRAARDLEVTGGEDRQVGRHRLVGAPVRGREPALTRRPRPGAPLAKTCLPRGTVIGCQSAPCRWGGRWPGNHQVAMWGWFIVTTSCRSASQFLSPR